MPIYWQDAPINWHRHFIGIPCQYIGTGRYLFLLSQVEWRNLTNFVPFKDIAELRVLYKCVLSKLLTFFQFTGKCVRTYFSLTSLRGPKRERDKVQRGQISCDLEVKCPCCCRKKRLVRVRFSIVFIVVTPHDNHSRFSCLF